MFLVFPRVFLGFPSFCSFSWIPGSESTHLDLEKLFLLSDSMENVKFNGKVEISEPEKISKKSEKKNIRTLFGEQLEMKHFAG